MERISGIHKYQGSLIRGHGSGFYFLQKLEYSSDGFPIDTNTNCATSRNTGGANYNELMSYVIIMALSVLRKRILQTRMLSHPVGLDVCFLVGPFVYFHTSCVRTAKALARLHGCAGSPEPSLVAYVISTIIS